MGKGHKDFPRALVLHRPDETLDDGDAAVLANGAETLVDTPATAPTSESLVNELRALTGAA